MKRILSSLMICSLFLSSFTMGQEAFFENFDASNQFPAGWATFRGANNAGTTQDWRINTTSGYSPPNCAFVQYENTGSNLAQDWMVTPLIDLSGLANPALTFMTAQQWEPNYGSIYKILVSTTSQTAHSEFTEIASWTELQLGNVAAWGQKGVSLAAYSGQQVYIAFMMQQSDGDNWYVDNVRVSNVAQEGISLQSINMNSVAVAGNVPVSATFQNLGSASINSFTASYTVDGETVTQEFSGVNVPFTSNHTFNFGQQWAATAGMHEITVQITHINGVALETPETESFTVNVAFGSSPKLSLVEHFTASTCPPCFGYNTNHFNTNFINQHGANFALIRYQMNFPGAGDPYYTAEAGARRAYYGVNAIPSVFINANPHGVSTATALLSGINAGNNQPGLAQINATHTINGDEITVNAEITPYIDGEYRVHVVVFENVTTGNVASNGETSFEHVMMKMVPDPNGTAVTFQGGEPFSLSLTQNMSSTNVEEMSDLGVVVFVQEHTSKIVLNAGYSEETMSTRDVTAAARVSFAPNPAKEMIQISTDEPVQVQILDVTGKVVKTQKDVQNGAQIQLGGLAKGLYIITFEGQNFKKVQKLLVK